MGRDCFMDNMLEGIGIVFSFSLNNEYPLFDISTQKNEKRLGDQSLPR